jgi:hypothetical protein
MATKANLVMDQGADFSATITLTDESGNLIDLSGYTGRSQMRKFYTSNTYYTFDVTLNANTASILLTMSAANTNQISSGRYVYDLEVISGGSVVSRILEGIVTVTPQVTR